MPLAETLSEFIRACFSGIWVESHEHQDAIAEIGKLCRDEKWRMAVWDLERGLRTGPSNETGATDPLAAIRAAASLLEPAGTKKKDKDNEEDPFAILVLVNLHRFLNSAEIVQALNKQLIAGKQSRTILVVLSPVVQIPVELEKLIVVVEHALPSREQLAEIARGVATDDGELPTGRELDHVLDAASGLTRNEAENAYSLSLVRHGRLEAEPLWTLKAQMLKKSGLLSLHRSEHGFSSLGGLVGLKHFCTRSLIQGERNPLARPRGILLLGVSGTGKSAFAKALGKETGRPTLTLDIGSLMGSLVGQTETNVRQALKIADAMAPCILFADEVEKSLSGATGGSGDSGVSARLFGTLLSWMNDHESEVYLVATANDISRLPPEFSRAERFDGVFFLDLPHAQEKKAIWDLYVNKYGLSPNQKMPPDEKWTGAEIQSCCRLSALLQVPLLMAAEHIVPVAVTAAESVERLRSWADGRCLGASRVGLYRRQLETSSSRRRVSRDTGESLN
jgi:hypothetical protein